MSSRDPRVDAYIEKSAEFAKPILTYIRDIVHEACPDVEETMKWSFPHFEYHGVLCSMAAFKAHCALGFWKAPLLMPDRADERDGMGQMGKITSIDDLPPKRELLRLVKEAAKLNEAGVKVERKKAPAKAPLETPPELAAALSKNREAKKTFDAFSPSHKREYVEWICDAKTDATRQKRIAQAVEWMAEGKSRNWKYVKK